MSSRLPSHSAALALSGLLTLGALAGVAAPATAHRPATSVAGMQTPRHSTAVAPLRVKVRSVVAGLENPWDVQPIGGGTLLVTERDKARLSVVREGKRHTVRFPSASVWVAGETGLMSVAVDPRFAETGRFWTCQGWNAEGDAADPANPRDQTSLGGKVLRVQRTTGAAMPDNPYADAGNAPQRLVYTYGHRNVQGLAQRPSDGALVSVEHGSYRDDEVNALAPAADFGWNPGPGYDESVPMTDQSLPGQQTEAIWSSGDPTIATSGAAWTSGSRWGAYDSTLAVGTLVGERMIFIRFDKTLHQIDVSTPAATRRYGRLRSVTSLRNGDLLVTTSNGTDDRILRVSPR